MLNIICLILVIIGGLNWGLVGFLKWDLVANLFGGGDMYALVPRIIYGLVGLAALYMLVTIGNWLKK